MAGWVRAEAPQMRNKGAFINATANDLTVSGGEVIATPAPVSRSNFERRFAFWRQDTGEFVYLPYDVPCFDAAGNRLWGFRLDCQRVVSVVHGGRLKLWLLHFKGDASPVRDLVVYDTGYQYVP